MDPCSKMDVFQPEQQVKTTVRPSGSKSDIPESLGGEIRDDSIIGDLLYDCAT